jgi:hypothetical protein
MPVDKFWQRIRSVKALKALRGILTVPAFSVPCGQVEDCLFFDGTTGGAVITVTPPPFTDFTTAVTIEAWINVFGHQSDTKYSVFVRKQATLNQFPQYELAIKNGLLYFIWYKGAAGAQAVSSLMVPTNTWTHVAVSWDGTTVRFYVDGVADTQTTALASPVDAYVSGPIYIGVGDGQVSLGHATINDFLGYIDELRVWNVGRTADQIEFSRFTPRDLVLDTALKFYVKFNQGSGTLIKDEVSTLTYSFSATAISWLGSGYPLKYLASFIVAQFEINVANDFSFNFPISKPYETVNFMPVIRWTDSDSGEVRRYKLWALAGVDINPLPELYMGQRIDKDCFLEIWNVDGAETVDLTSSFKLETSLLHELLAEADAQTADDTLTIDQTLAENFSLALPAPFNTVQTY